MSSRCTWSSVRKIRIFYFYHFRPSLPLWKMTTNQLCSFKLKNWGFWKKCNWIEPWFVECVDTWGSNNKCTKGILFVNFFLVFHVIQPFQFFFATNTFFTCKFISVKTNTFKLIYNLLWQLFDHLMFWVEFTQQSDMNVWN